MTFKNSLVDAPRLPLTFDRCLKSIRVSDMICHKHILNSQGFVGHFRIYEMQLSPLHVSNCRGPARGGWMGRVGE